MIQPHIPKPQRVPVGLAVDRWAPVAVDAVEAEDTALEQALGFRIRRAPAIERVGEDIVFEENIFRPEMLEVPPPAVVKHAAADDDELVGFIGIKLQW